ARCGRPARARSAQEGIPPASPFVTLTFVRPRPCPTDGRGRTRITTPAPPGGSVHTVSGVVFVNPAAGSELTDDAVRKHFPGHQVVECPGAEIPDRVAAAIDGAERP